MKWEAAHPTGSGTSMVRPEHPHSMTWTHLCIGVGLAAGRVRTGRLKLLTSGCTAHATMPGQPRPQSLACESCLA